LINERFSSRSLREMQSSALSPTKMIKATPTVYIVIPVHNRLEATRECLESLSCQTYPYYQIVLVDDGSSDGTSEYVKENYPDVTILKGDGDLWWTGATNLGVRYAQGVCCEDDYVLTLNNDTVLPADYLEIMMSLSIRASKALIGSIARDYSRRDVCVDEGVGIRWFSAKFIKLKGPSESGSDSFYSTSVLSGRGTLIPVSAFHAVGLYDAQNFPHYAADYDFSLRAAMAGYDLLLHPNCYLYSRTDLTGISNVHNRVSFPLWLKSFGSVKSPNNLKVRFHFGLRHAPALCTPSFIICDFIRVTLGTLRNQIRNMV
jgi:GT2 family glycosyltransferase